MAVFSYRALTPTEPRIRLVSLHPVHSNLSSPIEATSPVAGLRQRAHQIAETITCSLFHVSLNNAPEYTALSYTWGNITDVRSVVINGAVLEVSANLELALRHLRHHDLPQVLWIDAVCIDQQNNVEKSEQVSHMRQIYGRAKSVLTWLGPSSDDSDHAMDWIERFGSRAHDLAIGTTPDLQLINLLRAYDDNSRSHADDSISDFLADLHKEFANGVLADNEVVKALSNLFRRRYWSRVWVVQEVAMATALTIRCGNKMAREDSLHHAMRLLRNFLHYVALTKSGSEASSAEGIYSKYAINLFKARRMQGSPPLIYLLRMFRQQGATDPRDKIIALLGIARDVDELGIVVDYGKTVQEVYTSAARAFINAGFFDMLSLVSQERQIPDLPSWVPDWSYTITHDPLQQRTLNRKSDPLEAPLQPEYAAAGTLKPIAPSRLDKIEWRAPLKLSVIEIGKIVETGSVWKTDQEGRLLADLVSLASRSAADVSTVYANIVRTAAADQDIRKGTKKPRLDEAIVSSISDKIPWSDLLTVSKSTLESLGLSHYGMQLRSAANVRRPMLLSSGHIGLAPGLAMKGDIACVVLGSPVPHIFRQTDAKAELVGEAYIHNAMDGQLADASKAQELFVS